MKKIIAALVIFIVAIFLVQFTQFTPYGQIEYSGYVIGNIDVAKNLTGDERKGSSLNLSPTKELDSIYKQMFSYYYGENKDYLDYTYPLFFNDNQALYLLNNTGHLLDSHFEKYEVQTNTVLSRGVLFDQTQVQKDTEVYYFYVLDNGLFINSLPITINVETKKTVIPSNSIIYFQENTLRYYEIDDSKLILNEISGLDKNSKITIDESEMNYRNFLIQVGVISEEKVMNPVKDDKPTNDITKSPIKVPSVIPDDDYIDDGNINEGTGNGGGSGDGTYKYFKPIVTNSPYTTTVYSASSSINIKDPQGHIVKNRVEIQVWNQGKVYMRKYIKKTQDFTLTGLEPNSKYTIYTKYSYEEENGEIKEVELNQYTIHTREITDLPNINIESSKGDIFSTQVELKDIKVKGTLENEALLNISKLVFVAGDNSLNLSSTQLSYLKTGQAFTYKSPSRLPSNSTIDYHFIAYDRFGNELIIKGSEGQTRTCKKTPIVTLKAVANKVSLITLKITNDNPDKVDIKNYRLVITDSEGTVLKEEKITKDSYTFEDLDAGKVLTATIYGDFDIDDGHGIQKNQTLTSVQIVSLPLSSLGKISTKTEIIDTTKNSIDFDFSVDRRQTNEKLIQLIDQITIIVSDNKGNVMKRKISEDEIKLIKNKGIVPIGFDNLMSKTTYNIKIEIVVKHGTSQYDYTALNNIDTFKTIRNPIEIQIRNVTITEESIELETRAIDEDGASIDGYVGVRVKDSAQNILDVFLVNTITGGENGWKTYKINKLEPGSYYTFQFYSVEYNEGYTNKTVEYNKEIYKISYDVPRGITGSLNVGTITNSTEKYTSLVEMVYSVRGYNNNILNEEYHFEVLENGVVYDTFTYTMNGSIAVDNSSRPITLELPADREYKVILYVRDTLNQTRIDLGSTTFNTLRNWDTISSVSEFYTKIRKNPGGNFYILKDLNLGTIPDSTYIIDTKFYGNLDFQGNQLTADIRGNGLAVFKENTGIIQNLVFNVKFGSSQLLEKSAGLVLTNSNGGEIKNIMVNFDGCSANAHDGIGGVIYENKKGASFHHFVINANSSLYTKHKASYGVATNGGDIYDGYVQGMSIDGTFPNEELYEIDTSGNFVSEDYFKQVGGICGENQVTGIVQRVYSAAKVLRNQTKLGPDSNSLIGSNEEDSIGNVVGLNRGIVKNMFSYGDGNYQNEFADFGPTVGRNRYGNTINSESYYISDYKHNDDRLNKRVTKLMLYDIDFHKQVLNNNNESGSFNLDYVLTGYYPQLNLPVYFPRQKIVELPQVDQSESVDIKSSRVISQTDTSAIIEVMLNNPGSGDVRNITTSNLGSVKILSFEHDKKSTKVQIEISQPNIYTNKYSFLSVSVKNNFTGGIDVIRKYEPGDKTIDVSFYKYIDSKADWIENVVKKPTENYKLTNDLDFTGIADTSLCIDTFSGTLDGGGHTISNMNFTSKTALITNFYGTLQNINFDNFYGKTFANLLYTTGSQYVTKVDNVHIENFIFTYRTNATSIFGYNFTGTISNTSANNITFKTNTHARTTVEIGAFVNNLADGGTIENSFVTNFNVDVDSNGYSYGIGGLVSYVGKGTIRNCYTQGQIKTTTKTIGGIAARVSSLTNSRIENCYSDVDIYSEDATFNSTKDNPAAGGLVGSGSASMSNCLSVGDLYSTLPDIKLNRIYQTKSIENNKNYMDNIYAFKNQLINGVIDVGWKPTALAGLLSYTDLCKESTYKDLILLGNAFDYSNVSQGNLPKLRDTNGQVMGHQSNLKLREDEIEFEVKSVAVTENSSGTNALLEIHVKHPEAMTFDSIKIKNDELKVNTMSVVPTIDKTISVLQVNVQPNKYYDVYTLETVLGSYNGQQIRTKEEVKIDLQFFKQISSFSDWQQMDPNSYENYQLTSSIDFAGYEDTMRKNICVNRFVGIVDNNGNRPILSNITLTINSSSSPTSIFGYVTSEMSNINVTNFTLNRGNGYNPATSINIAGFIKELNGLLKNVDVSDVNLFNPDKGSYTTAAYSYRNNASNVGFIALGGANFYGRVENMKMKNVVLKGYGSLGAVFGTGGDAIDNSTFENISVEGYGSIIGGLRGGTQGTSRIVSNCTIKDVTVVGADYVGGIVGQTGRVEYSTISNVQVYGRTYVGGLLGYGSCTGNYVNNIMVTGQKGVGGIVGYDIHTDTKNNHIFNSIISATKTIDPKLKELGIASTTDPGYYVGGIGGYNNVNSYINSENSVQKCSITGVKNVGGIFGITTGYTRDNYVVESTIIGEENVGGILGIYDTYNLRDIQNNYVYADVTATIQGAGGIVGNMNNTPDSVGNHKTTIYNNIFNSYTQPLTASRYAGGIAGIVQTSGKDVKWDGNIILGDIKTTTSGYISGITSGNGKNLNIFTNTLVYDAIKVDEQKVSPASSGTSSYQLKSINDFANKTTYTSVGFLELTTNATTNSNSFRWDFSKINDGTDVYMPILYLKNMPAAGNENTFNAYQYQLNHLIKLKNGITTKSARFKKSEDISHIIYASDIDKLNIEFLEGGDYSYYLNNDEDNIIQMEGNIITLQTDYKTSCTITILFGNEEKQIEIDPSLYTYKTMLQGENYYLIDKDGQLIDSKKQTTGKFIHLYNGLMLTSDGEVLNTLGETVRKINDVNVISQVQSLVNGTHDNKNIVTYGRYSFVDKVYRAMTLWIKNEKLYAIDGKLDIYPNQFIIDNYQDETYETVLGTDGVLYNLKDEIHLPKDFKNENIRSLAQNVDSTSYYSVIVYENGSILVWNYTNGEIVYQKEVQEDVSLFDFASNFFMQRSSLIPKETSKAFEAVEILEDKLLDMSIEEAKAIVSSKENTSLDNSLQNKNETNSSNSNQNTLLNTSSQYVSVYDSINKEYVLYSSRDILNSEISSDHLKSENVKISSDMNLSQYYAVPSMKIQSQNSLIGITMFISVIISSLICVTYLTLKKRAMK